MKSRSAFVLVPLAAGLIAGCAENGALTTGSLNPAVVNEKTKEAAATEQACATLATKIQSLNKDGIAAKVEKAAAKKYKLKNADLAKVNELNKANADFQAKCSNYPMTSVAAVTPPEAADAKADAKDAKAAKTAKTANPPVPPRKSATAAAAAATKQQAATTQAPASTAAAAPSPAKAASAQQAAKPQTATVASAEPETKQASAQAQPTSASTSPFAAPRLSAVPTMVTTSGTP